MQKMKLAIGLIVVLALTATLHADTDSVSVSGSIDKPGDWTVARVKTELADEIKPLEYTGHNQQKHTSNAVPLIALLKASGVSTQLKQDPKADAKSKHHELRLVVVVTGKDGYVATFSLAELLSDLGNKPAWLAIDADGQPLSATEGPMKLIVPDDQKPARWVHAVQTISVIDVTAASTAPAK